MYSSNISPCRGVAQPGRALGSGPRGRWFESTRPDQLIQRFTARRSAPGRFVCNEIATASAVVVERRNPLADTDASCVEAKGRIAALAVPVPSRQKCSPSLNVWRLFLDVYTGSMSKDSCVVQSLGGALDAGHILTERTPSGRGRAAEGALAHNQKEAGHREHHHVAP